MANPLTITLTTPSKQYNGQTDIPNVQIAGLEAGDNVSVVTGDYSLGTYSETYEFDLSGANADKYYIDEVIDGPFSIIPKNITVTFIQGKNTKTYDDSDDIPTDSYTIDGKISDEDVSVFLEYTDPGTYSSKNDFYLNGDNSDNYNISQIINFFKVDKDPLAQNICFIAGTKIKTDQEIIPIEKINPRIHTINNKVITSIIRSINIFDEYLVCFEKDSLGSNIPSERTIMSKNHKIYLNDYFYPAYKFLDTSPLIRKIRYNGEILYNILLEENDIILANDIICESVDNNTEFATFVKTLNNLPAKEQNELINKYNSLSIKNYTPCNY